MRKLGSGLPILAAAAAAAALALCAGVPSAAEPLEPVLTRHSISLGSGALNYSVEAGQLPIRDVETGEPHGFIFYTAYRVGAPSDRRPVTFVWNGGPGAASDALHFELVGPKRAEGDRLVDNAETLLRTSDLVFVDPVGAGFSRPAKAAYAAEFYGTVGDVASITEFVRSWRVLHDAEGAPLFLLGESWGAGRAASVGYALQKRGAKVSGLILISGGSGLHTEDAPRDLAEALRVADLSVTSLYHGKLSPAVGTTPEAVRGAAEAWARTVYAPALARNADLTDAERRSVIEGLSRFTGLPADQIDAKTLRITPRQYRTRLIPGKTLGSLDMRLTADPAPDAAAAAMLRYFRQDLGYRTSAPYVGLESLTQGYAPGGAYPEGVGQRWNYATAAVSPEAMAAAIAAASGTGAGPPRLGPPLPATTELLALNAKVKVLVAAGQYDSLNSCTANAEVAAHLTGPAAQSLTFKCYAGGHMMYRDAAARLRLSTDLNQFIATTR